MSTFATGGVDHFERNNLSGMLPTGEPTDTPESEDPLQSPAHQNDFRKIQDWWIQARTRLSYQRYEMAVDDDFYDGLQWAEQDRLILEERGQPALVFNQIKPVVDWIIGTDKRTKFDWRVLPRTDDDRKPAEVKTKLLKYTDDVNHAQYHRSRAFADAVRVGIGWLESGIRSDPTDEPLYTRSESWRNMWWDDLSIEPDYSDARYLFRARWTDLDIAQTKFPQYRGKLKSASRTHDLFAGTDDDADSYQLYYRTDATGRPIHQRSYTEDASYAVDNRRERVRLVECWYRKPARRKVVHMYDIRDQDYQRLHGSVYDPEAAPSPYDEQVSRLVEDGYASVHDAIRMEVWCAIFCDGHLLQNSRSPYKHDRFPFIPVAGYRRKRDGAYYGVIRNQRDPQEDMNKRRSKALHILNSKYVIAEEGAVEDVDEAREEVASPDGWITIRPNKRFDINMDNTVAQQHLDMEARDVGYIRETGGVTTENLGHETNATSGRAIEARQNEGSVVTTELFDNKHFALNLQGEIHLSLAEQFYTAPKIIRLTTDTGSMEFQAINDVVIGPNGEIDVENDISATKADFVVDLADYRKSVRQAMHDQLMDIITSLLQMGGQGAEMAMAMLDVALDQADLPKKDLLVARVRKITGQMDPALEGSPEAEQMEQQKAEQEAEQAELQKRAVTAEIEKAEQEALKQKAEAALKQQQAAGQAVTSLQAMAEVGGQLLITPEISAMLDQLQEYVKEQVGPEEPAPQQLPMDQQQPPMVA